MALRLFSLICTGLVALELLGCGALNTAAGSVQNVFQSKESRAARQAKEHDAKCKSLGLKAGTEDYSLCRARLKAYGPHEPLL
jgi:hypothetical protein